jgi:RibD C-terminal domain
MSPQRLPFAPVRGRALATQPPASAAGGSSRRSSKRRRRPAGRTWRLPAELVGRQYLAAGLLDEIDLSIVPVLLGGGQGLFTGIEANDLQLEQLRAVDAKA